MSRENLVEIFRKSIRFSRNFCRNPLYLKGNFRKNTNKVLAPSSTQLPMKSFDKNLKIFSSKLIGANPEDFFSKNNENNHEKTLEVVGKLLLEQPLKEFLAIFSKNILGKSSGRKLSRNSSANLPANMRIILGETLVNVERTSEDFFFQVERDFQLGTSSFRGSWPYFPFERRTNIFCGFVCSEIVGLISSLWRDSHVF